MQSSLSKISLIEHLNKWCGFILIYWFSIYNIFVNIVILKYFSSPTLANHVFVDLTLCNVLSYWNMSGLGPIIPVKVNCNAKAYKVWRSHSLEKTHKDVMVKWPQTFHYIMYVALVMKLDSRSYFMANLHRD